MGKNRNQRLDAYSAKLASPQWLAFRQRIHELKGDVCEFCGNGVDRPHVHHKGYKAGREPWEYEPHEVALLCRVCHDRIHHWFDVARDAMNGLSPDVADALAVAIVCCGMEDHCIGDEVASLIRAFTQGTELKDELWNPIRRHFRALDLRLLPGDFKRTCLSFNAGEMDLISCRVEQFAKLSEKRQLEFVATLLARRNDPPSTPDSTEPILVADLIAKRAN